MSKRTIGVMGRLLDQDDGLGVYGLQLLRELLRLDPHTRYLILLDTPKSQHLFREFGNAETCVLPARSKLYWDQVVVPRAARRFNVDLIFNPKFSIPLFTRRPCVFVQQGSDWYVNPQNYPWWDNLYIRLMLPLYSLKATRTLAISQATLDDLEKYTCIDVRDSVVSYAGVGQNFNGERDEAALAQFRAEHRLPQRFILTVARALHVGHKHMPVYPGGNNERLLRGYLRYRREGGKLPLVVIGKRIDEYLRARGFTEQISPTCTSSASCRTRASTSPTSSPSASCSRRCARASASRSSRRSPAAARRSSRRPAPVRKSPAAPRASSTR